MKVEGLGTLWQPGEDPPQSVKDWWGEEEIDLEIFRMYETKNLDKLMIDKERVGTSTANIFNLSDGWLN